MSDRDDEERKIPEPFQVIISPLLFQAIKYNQTLRPSEKFLSDEDIEEFEKFKKQFKEFLNGLNKHDQSAFTMLSSVMSMWGYTRKYCGMCGRPVIGKGQHIQNRIACDTCGNSYRIAEELYRKEEQISEGSENTKTSNSNYKGRNYDPNYNRRRKQSWNNHSKDENPPRQNNTD